MYAIACKFPDQNRFQTINIHTGRQVNNWMYCTLFQSREKAVKTLKQIETVVIPGVELKVIKYKS